MAALQAEHFLAAHEELADSRTPQIATAENDQKTAEVRFSPGFFNVVQAMNRFAKNPMDDGAFWTPAPLLARLVAEGKSFT